MASGGGGGGGGDRDVQRKEGGGTASEVRHWHSDCAALSPALSERPVTEVAGKAPGQVLVTFGPLRRCKFKLLASPCTCRALCVLYPHETSSLTCAYT